MKKLSRILLCAAMTLALSLCTGFTWKPGLLIMPAPRPAAVQELSIVVNGQRVVYPDAQPVAKENRVFVPMAATFAQMGFPEEHMTWNADGVITATHPDVSYRPFNGDALVPGELVLTFCQQPKEFCFHYPGDTTASSHGDLVQVHYGWALELDPYVDPVTCRTYVPIGLMEEALGLDVTWDEATRTVYIDDSNALWNTAT